MAAPENINLKGLIPARMIAEQKPGKARSRALKKMLEAQKVLPAIRSAEGRVTRGLPGETHYDVIEREGRRRGLKLDKFGKEGIEKVPIEYINNKKKRDNVDHSHITLFIKKEYKTIIENIKKNE